ncbi:hypothetical protein EVAR_49129_1 [Eumeta japonica]|uniref:Uncharacterized protein n=1 Tax=Eumeta variegata TaxID=151549 RepID=A0A4C1YP01_EUMVA|nr:hypothetical protein EVAR_49129_1 [Eumeta japonica]
MLASLRWLMEPALPAAARRTAGAARRFPADGPNISGLIRNLVSGDKRRRLRPVGGALQLSVAVASSSYQICSTLETFLVPELFCGTALFRLATSLSRNIQRALTAALLF